MADDVLTPDELAEAVSPRARAVNRTAGGVPGSVDPDEITMARGSRQIMAPFPLSTDRPEVIPGVTRPFDPMEVDPIAQSVVAGTVMTPIAAARFLPEAAPAAARGAEALLTRAAAGAGGSASMGGNPLIGGLLGAFGGMPAMRAAMSPRAPVAAAPAPGMPPAPLPLAAYTTRAPSPPPPAAPSMLDRAVDMAKHPVRTAVRVAGSPVSLARRGLERTNPAVQGMAAAGGPTVQTAPIPTDVLTGDELAQFDTVDPGEIPMTPEQQNVLSVVARMLLGQSPQFPQGE